MEELDDEEEDLAPPDECEVLVVGAGPAGALAASRLAKQGRDVVLLHRPGPGSGVVEETIVPSAKPLLDRVRLTRVIETRVWLGTPRHGRVWGAPKLEIATVGLNDRGWKVPRDEFDRSQREHAKKSGARLLHRAGAQAPVRAGVVKVQLEDESEAEIRARVVIVATGRNTPDALVESTIVDELPATLAFTAHVPDAGDLADATVIEAVREGWLWWLPEKRGGVSLTLFTDRDEVLERGRDEVWQAALRGAIGPARGRKVAPERGTLASPRLRATREDVFLVGDASSCIDPLSSQGLEKALASGERAVLCANAILEEKIAKDLVFAYQRAWERKLYRAHARQTAFFYAREQRFKDAPFWKARHAYVLRLLQHGVSGLPKRFAPNPTLEPASALRRREDSLEVVPGLRLASGDAALSHLAGMPVAALIECCAGGVAIESALAKAAKHADLSATTPRAVAEGLRELYAEGFLVQET